MRIQPRLLQYMSAGGLSDQISVGEGRSEARVPLERRLKVTHMPAMDGTAELVQLTLTRSPPEFSKHDSDLPDRDFPSRSSDRGCDPPPRETSEGWIASNRAPVQSVATSQRSNLAQEFEAGL